MNREKINNIEAQINLKQAQIDVLNNEINSLLKDIFKERWELIEWDELEQYLKDNPEKNDKMGLIVIRGIGYSTTYARLKDGVLQIGPYYHNDHFPRGKPLYIHKDRLSFEDYHHNYNYKHTR